MTKSGATSTKLSIEVAVRSAPEKHSFDITALIPTLLAIAAAVVGYLIVERFARRREARSDLKSLMESFAGTLDAILADATAFYSVAGATPRARALAAVIKSKIAFIPELLATMRNAGVTLDAEGELIAFRQSITGGDFDSLDRAALRADDGKFVEIAAATQQLRRRVELSYYSCLVPNKVLGGRRRGRRTASNTQQWLRPDEVSCRPIASHRIQRSAAASNAVNRYEFEHKTAEN